ncbi:phosphatidate cytidylyltransferase [Methylocaldum szegediense]|uniref:Phosphatidate cytidylyltransferase n=1 Tax=Methylocaldum szegediense TaxID=73780 RepID=A0ABN8X6P7_9GAMM|nr:phosphatidate cytidylyltransferase [Methylocaldum szegediense]CAI8826335.1 putative CDP-diglyceride synthase [Methylocaldum szegediense]
MNFTHLPDVLLYALAGIFLLLALASILSVLLQKRHPEKDYTELRLRVRTWWLIVGVFCLVVVSSPTTAVVVLGLVSFLAFKEYLSLIPTRRADYRVLFWAYLAIPVQYYWVHKAWYGMFIIFIPVYMFLFLPLRMVLAGETQGFLRSAGIISWGLMTTVFCLSHMAYLLALPQPVGMHYNGATVLLFLVLLTQLNDVAQYLWGKSLGRHKIVPKVSPNKTWAGFLGGVATTTLLAWLIAPWLTPLTEMESVLAGLLIGVCGFVGDVVISALKRDIGVKDSGSLLPGHGGILDRLDSLTYTAPLFFHFIRYLHY